MHIPLLRKIIFLILLGVVSTIVITLTIYLIERLPTPLLDKSINFHSVIMHDTNKLIIYISSRTHDINFNEATDPDIQQINEINYALTKFLSETKTLYHEYEFTPGTKTLAKLQKETDQLHHLLGRISGTHNTDLSVLRGPIYSVVDGLQQLYRLHEVDDTHGREQLVRYQKQHALIIFPLITVIFLFSGLLGYLLIRNIYNSLAMQHKLEKELRDSARNHQQILDSIFVFVGLFTVDGRLIEVNETPLQATGLRRDEVIGKFIWETYTIAYSQESIDTLKSCISQAAAGKVVRQDIKILIKGGQFVIMDSTFSPVYDDTGSIVSVIGSGVDITARRVMEDKMRASEERYRMLLESQRDGVFVSQDFKFVFANEALPKMLGYTHDEFLGMDFKAIVAPEFLDLWTSRYTLRIGTGPEPPSKYELRMLRKGGTEDIWVVLQAQRIEYDGKPAVFGVIHDLTERRLAEEALRISEEELRRLNESLEDRVAERAKELHNERNFINSVLETAGALVFVFDKQGHVVRFNRACEKLTGYHFDEIKDKPFWKILVPAEQVPSILSLLNNLSDHNLSAKHESEWLTRLGEQRLIEWTYSILKDENIKGFAFIIGTGIDITERKQAEVSLIKAKEEAEQASLAKSQFLSRMSHELRTPMNAILGFSQILELEIQAPEQLDSVREILHASRHLLDLINELLDLSRIEAGRLHVTLEPLNPVTLMSEAISLVRPLVEKKNLVLYNQITPDCAQKVLADRTRLRQVLVNLLSNAAKYNNEGGSIRVECTSFDEDHLRFSVTDSGPGIAREKQSLLFQPFERLGAEDTVEEGAGIGLALSKRLVELMGGTIGMHSDAGEGTTFWLDLPRALPRDQDLAPGIDAAVPDKEIRFKVLYVEDNMANLRLVERVLARYPSLFLISAVNGETGLELARAHHPDVILLDIHLPGIDGYEVLKRLGKDPATAVIPVIAISADAMPLDIERGMKAGFRHYLTKPINIEELVKVINTFLPGDNSKTAIRH